MWHKNKEKSPKGCQCSLLLCGLHFPKSYFCRSAFLVNIYNETTLVWAPPPHNLGPFSLIRTQARGSQKT